MNKYPTLYLQGGQTLRIHDNGACLGNKTPKTKTKKRGGGKIQVTTGGRATAAALRLLPLPPKS